MRSRMRAVQLAVIVAFLAAVTACASHAPHTLTPAGVVVYQANEAVVGIGTLQHAAIELNKTESCDQSGANCKPLLSADNTRVVVDATTDALTAMKAVPTGWKATVSAALDRVNLRLDDAGKQRLKPYIEAARTIVNGQ